MTGIILFFFFSFMVLFNTDHQTELLFMGYLQDSSGHIDVYQWSVPVVYDWNSDGKKDLIVGQKYYDGLKAHGYVSYYQNIGTNASPVFGQPIYLKACSDACLLDVMGEG
jgi:hypothetical protein